MYEFPNPQSNHASTPNLSAGRPPPNAIEDDAPQRRPQAHSSWLEIALHKSALQLINVAQRRVAVTGQIRQLWAKGRRTTHLCWRANAGGYFLAKEAVRCLESVHVDERRARRAAGAAHQPANHTVIVGLGSGHRGRWRRGRNHIHCIFREDLELGDRQMTRGSGLLDRHKLPAHSSRATHHVRLRVKDTIC